MPQDLPTLESIANDASYLLSDDWGEDEYERFMAKSVEEKVRYFFCSSDCDAFAIALRRMTGWPIRGLLSDHGSIHRFVEAPDGRFLDAGGWQTVDSFKKRYGLETALISDPGDEALCLGYFPDEYEGFDEGLFKAVSAIRNLPWAPFNDPDFKSVFGKPLLGVDVPHPEDNQEPSSATLP